jgi:hypothetical protein
MHPNADGVILMHPDVSVHTKSIKTKPPYGETVAKMSSLEAAESALGIVVEVSSRPKVPFFLIKNAFSNLISCLINCCRMSSKIDPNGALSKHINKYLLKKASETKH